MASKNHGTGRPVARADQAEIPGTESPNRDPELHAIGLGLLDLEERRKSIQGAEKDKRAEAAAALHKRNLKEYKVDGIDLWLEGKESVKVKKDGGRPKGRIKKVVAEVVADQEPIA